jgi:acetyltransferase-like isoleucine patch superfamily enzyme
MISAKNRVQLGDDVLLGPSVLITDHSHEFSNPNMPIHLQGMTAGGSVYIEKNCWLGHGSAVVGASSDVIIGQNSVIGANSVVTQSVPPYSIVVGSPARVIRQFDPASGNWVKRRTVRDSTHKA